MGYKKIEKYKNKKPKVVDIIAVTYGQNENLKCFINSIKSQTSDSWNLIIIHDGINQELKDDLLKNGYLTDNVTLLQYPERTECWGHKLREWALKKVVQNDFVLLTNGDNYYAPTMIENVISADAQLVYFDCVLSHANKRNFNKKDYGFLNTELRKSFIDMGCVVVDSKLAKEVGFKTYGFSADWDYFEEILKLNPTVKKINKILFVHN